METPKFIAAIFLMI